MGGVWGWISDFKVQLSGFGVHESGGGVILGGKGKLTWGWYREGMVLMRAWLVVACKESPLPYEECIRAIVAASIIDMLQQNAGASESEVELTEWLDGKFKNSWSATKGRGAIDDGNL